MIDTVLDGKYRIERLIGRGGMGSVYKALHVQLDRPVAVKVLKYELVADNESSARFEREARASARIQHPNVVRVYDIGTSEGRTYLVMELLEGDSLRALLQATGALDLKVMLEIVRQIAAALSAAHAQGIVHRDVKPENVIGRFDAAGTPHVKVVDFGLAKLLMSSDSTQLTSPGTIMGTPKYMAPERFSSEPVDERVDVYALGVMLYEMASGQVPFDGTFTEIVGKHLHVAPSPVALLRPNLPPELDGVLLHALAKNPADRTPSADALVNELEVALASVADQPLETTRMTPASGNATTPIPANFLDTPWSTDHGVTIPPSINASAPRLGTDTGSARNSEETLVRQKTALPGAINVGAVEDTVPPRTPGAILAKRKQVAAVGTIALVAILASLGWALSARPSDDAPSSNSATIAHPNAKDADVTVTNDASSDGSVSPPSDSRRQDTVGNPNEPATGSEPVRPQNEESNNNIGQREREVAEKAEALRLKRIRRIEERRREAERKRGGGDRD